MIRISGVIISLMAVISVKAQCRLTVDINGLKNNKGSVCLFLYNNPDGFPEKSKNVFRNGIIDKIAGNKAQYTFTDIPPGKYAVALFHDEDNSRQLKTNWLGIPVEETGASNNAKGHWGPPKFRDAAFWLSRDTVIHITVTTL